MRNKVINSEYVIRGNCPLFACRCCHTKYGWQHQEWCEMYQITNSACSDCLYFGGHPGICLHPEAKRKRKEDLPHEKDKCSL